MEAVQAPLPTGKTEVKVISSGNNKTILGLIGISTQTAIQALYSTDTDTDTHACTSSGHEVGDTHTAESQWKWLSAQQTSPVSLVSVARACGMHRNLALELLAPKHEHPLPTYYFACGKHTA